MTFCTALNCIDGRAQLPVIRYLQELWGRPHVDLITAPGMVRWLADPADSGVRRSVLSSLEISTRAHGSSQVAVVAHADCAGNPAADELQKQQLGRAVAHVAAWRPDLLVLGLWLDGDLVVSPLFRHGPTEAGSPEGDAADSG